MLDFTKLYVDDTPHYIKETGFTAEGEHASVGTNLPAAK
jgi:hypothetical protein